ncbi:MAG: hypothetical protein PVF08_05995 [Gammaproteobacteria bacterium]|jgi:hypothetical protein
MKKISLIGVAVFLVAGLDTYTLAGPNGGGGGDDYRYVGYSTSYAAADIGINGMNEICKEDFEEEEARMCTSTEVFESPNIPASGIGAGWVQPIVTGFFLENDRAYYLVNGKVMSPNDIVSGLNCSAWNTISGDANGTYITTRPNTSGSFSIGITYDTCDEEWRVACCIPE